MRSTGPGRSNPLTPAFRKIQPDEAPHCGNELNSTPPREMALSDRARLGPNVRQSIAGPVGAGVLAPPPDALFAVRTRTL
jgi:hypothetical protein